MDEAKMRSVGNFLCLWSVLLSLLHCSDAVDGLIEGHLACRNLFFLFARMYGQQFRVSFTVQQAGQTLKSMLTYKG